MQRAPFERGRCSKDTCALCLTFKSRLCSSHSAAFATRVPSDCKNGSGKSEHLGNAATAGYGVVGGGLHGPGGGGGRGRQAPDVTALSSPLSIRLALRKQWFEVAFVLGFTQVYATHSGLLLHSAQHAAAVAMLVMFAMEPVPMILLSASLQGWAAECDDAAVTASDGAPLAVDSAATASVSNKDMAGKVVL